MTFRRSQFLSILLVIVAWAGAAGTATAEKTEFRIAYDVSGKRDPFVPLIGKNVEIQNVNRLKSIDDVVIEGILIDPAEGSVVIVNGQVLKKGDFIGGFEIKDIQNHFVLFLRDGQTHKVDYGIEKES